MDGEHNMNACPTYKVLVVDDDKQLVESIAEYLQEQNLDVCKEYGGEGQSQESANTSQT